MRTQLDRIAPLVAAAAAILVGTAPSATADTHVVPTDCITVNVSGTVCDDNSIDDSPPGGDVDPQYPYPYPISEGPSEFGPGGPGVQGHR